MTRKDDRLLTPFCQYRYKNRPYKRDDLERRLNTMQNAGACMIISIHANWHMDCSHRGPIVYYLESSADSQKLASCIQEQLNQVQRYRKLPKTSQCFLLRRAKIPAILIELGFLSNPWERLELSNETYQNTLIEAIIQGLDHGKFNYISKYPNQRVGLSRTIP